MPKNEQNIRANIYLGIQKIFKNFLKFRFSKKASKFDEISRVVWWIPNQLGDFVKNFVPYWKNLTCINNTTNYLWFLSLFGNKKSFRTTKQTYLPAQFCFSVLCLEFDQHKPCFKFEAPFQTSVQSTTFRAQCFNLWNESSRDFEDDFPMFCRLLHIFSFFFLVSQLIQVSAKVMRVRGRTI